MSDSKGFLHPETLSKIQRLELRARSVVEGFLNGNHRSPFFGQSVEFAQHRPYVAGDDLRHVDWKVWARQDRLYVKQFEEETDLRCTVVLDVSASMNYGQGDLTKLQYAATVAASLAWLIQRQQDSVGLILWNEKITSQLPQRSSETALRQLLEQISQSVLVAEKSEIASAGQAVAENEINVEPVFRHLVNAYPKRSLFVIVSDLLVDLESLRRGIRGLAAAGNEILLLHVMDDEELDFPFQQPSQFEGLEDGFWLRCNPKDLRDGYLQELEQYLETVRQMMSSYDVDYRLVRTSESLAGAITAFLSRRSRRLGR